MMPRAVEIRRAEKRDNEQQMRKKLTLSGLLYYSARLRDRSPQQKQARGVKKEPIKLGSVNTRILRPTTSPVYGYPSS